MYLFMFEYLFQGKWPFISLKDVLTLDFPTTEPSNLFSFTSPQTTNRAGIIDAENIS